MLCCWGESYCNTFAAAACGFLNVVFWSLLVFFFFLFSLFLFVVPSFCSSFVLLVFSFSASPSSRLICNVNDAPEITRKLFAVGGFVLGTQARTQSGDGPRPLTSVSGAGYQSRPPGTAGARANAPGAAKLAPMLPFKATSDGGAEAQASEMETRVHSLLEASAAAATKGDLMLALERAKEAGRRERALCKFKESASLGDSISLDLTFAVCFNLAHTVRAGCGVGVCVEWVCGWVGETSYLSCSPPPPRSLQYHLNKMYAEALSAYNLIVKNRQYPQAARLRVNMGNIHVAQGNHAAAIKQYRMALDQVPPTSASSGWREGVCRQGHHNITRLPSPRHRPRDAHAHPAQHWLHPHAPGCVRRGHLRVRGRHGDGARCAGGL